MQVYASVLDMAARVFDMMRSAQEGGGPQPVHYQISGRLGVKAGRWPASTIPFTSKGEIDLQGLTRK